METACRAPARQAGSVYVPTECREMDTLVPPQFVAIVKNCLKLCLRYVWRSVCNGIVVVAP
jgi:hypothetical protein